ncbi:hypothetical protein [Variovorax paradoxus]|uniref:hypothetical protein n=1 Tax=Variovorax paradoxus TaxID=34073 RepID=UPI003D64D51A
MPSLLFLMKLQHVQLPARITFPEEIRHVSVLLATGLIEATIEAVGVSTRYNVPSRLATVRCIADEGLREIATMGNLPDFIGASMGFARRLHLI